MVLLAMRIVANNFLGLDNNRSIILPCFVFSSEMEFKSVWDKPNSATSAPEIRAEHSRSTKRKHHLKTKTPLKAVNSIALWGSGSN